MVIQDEPSLTPQPLTLLPSLFLQGLQLNAARDACVARGPGGFHIQLVRLNEIDDYDAMFEVRALDWSAGTCTHPEGACLIVVTPACVVSMWLKAPNEAGGPL